MRIKSILLKCLPVIFFAAALPCVCFGQAIGSFSGELVLRALPDGRVMELVQPLTYTDSRGISWPVPAGVKVDGASIPSVFWSIIGAPYTGKYREASIIHDYYCQTRSRHWKAVHRVFLDGMNARGVDPVQAKLMYLAVYRFGPRWDFDVDACYCKGCPLCDTPDLRRVKRYQPRYNPDDFAEIKRELESRRASIEDIESIADYQINSEILRK
jgi:hypothetical protein